MSAGITTSPMLPDAPIETRIPEQKVFEGRAFPLVLEPPRGWAGARPEACAAHFARTRSDLETRLMQHGAILFRRFPFRNARDFDAFVQGIGWPSFPYVGGAAPRLHVVGDVFTTNEAPPDQPIPFHHEMAQVPSFPGKLYFFCETPPESGGETAICPSAQVYQRMAAAAPEFVARLRSLGVRYTRVLPDGDDPSSPIGRGWQSTYQTQERAEVEARCQALGENFEWLPDGCLRVTSKVLSAVREEPRTGKLTWFNAVIAAYEGWKDQRNNPERAVLFGDGSPLDPVGMTLLHEVFDALAVAFPWQAGDVLLIDNHLTLHSRRSFTGTRRVLASLAR